MYVYKIAVSLQYMMWDKGYLVFITHNP